jgi:hypothetical protein
MILTMTNFLTSRATWKWLLLDVDIAYLPLFHLLRFHRLVAALLLFVEAILVLLHS